jgi:hypothetical protein
MTKDFSGCVRGFTHIYQTEIWRLVALPSPSSSAQLCRSARLSVEKHKNSMVWMNEDLVILLDPSVFFLPLPCWRVCTSNLFCGLSPKFTYILLICTELKLEISTVPMPGTSWSFTSSKFL